MSDNTENINELDISLCKAMDIMESPEFITEEQLQEVLTNENEMNACHDIFSSTLYLRIEKEASELDIEKELEQFKKKHRAKSMRLILRIGMSAVAMIAIALFSYYFFSNKDSVAEPIVLFAADDSPQQVILQKETGEQVVLEEGESLEKQASRELLAAKKQNMLDYSIAEQHKSSNVKGEKHTLTVPRGKNVKILLSDGTEVWLNANSTLKYPAVFLGEERIVQLKGEAYFKVSKDIDHPFLVEAQGVLTRVLGTEFNITAYTPEDTHVVLISGSVEVSSTEGQSYLKINPGENAHLQTNGEFALSNVDTDSYLLWKDGYFYFDDMTLSEIMLEIGRWYNVDIRFYDREVMDLKMRFIADRTEGLDHVITLLNRMKKVNVAFEGNVLVVK